MKNAIRETIKEIIDIIRKALNTPTKVVIIPLSNIPAGTKMYDKVLSMPENTSRFSLGRSSGRKMYTTLRIRLKIDRSHHKVQDLQ